MFLKIKKYVSWAPLTLDWSQNWHSHLSYPQSFLAKSPTRNFSKFDLRQKDFQQNRQDSCGVSIEWTRQRRPDLIYVSTFKIVKVEIQNLLLPSTRWEWHQLHLAWLSVYKGELSKYLKNWYKQELKEERTLKKGKRNCAWTLLKVWRDFSTWEKVNKSLGEKRSPLFSNKHGNQSM